MTRIEFLRSRHSVRKYSQEPLPEELVKKIEAEITMVNTHEAGMHFRLVCGDSKPFEGFRASYGFFSGVKNYIAVVVDPSFPDTYERAGYFSQQIVMEAVSSGLGTCYVGGTFDVSKVPVNLRAGEEILYLITLGYPAHVRQTPIGSLAMKIMHRHDKAPEDFYVTSDGIILATAKQSCPWLMDGLAGLASAPSSLNKQPVRIFARRDNGALEICAKVENPNPKSLIDLGIGKFNFAFASQTEPEWGNGSPFYSIS